MAFHPNSKGKKQAPTGESKEAPAKKVNNEPLEKAKDLTDLKARHPAFMAPEGEDNTYPAEIASRLDHPVQVSYGEDAMMIPPRGRIKIGNYQKLGALPSGVLLHKASS